MPTLLMLILKLVDRSTRPRIGRMAVLSVLAMVFLAIGVTSLAVALWIVLARATDPAIAALIMGGAGFALAGLMLLLARAQLRPRPAAMSLQEAEAALSAFMARQEGSAVWTPVVAAVVLGFLLTRRR